MTTYQSQLADGYSQTKWVAEMLVQKARSRGLPVVIYRLGRYDAEIMEHINKHFCFYSLFLKTM